MSNPPVIQHATLCYAMFYFVNNSIEYNNCSFYVINWNKLAPYRTGGRLLLTANFKVKWHKN